MIKRLSILSMVAAATTAAAPRAMAADLVRVDVPFEFVVAGQPLPSGEYRFVMDENAKIVHVYSKARGHVALTVCQPVPKATRDVGLVFHKHAGQRFLKSVATDRGFDVTLPTTHAERVAEAADGAGRTIAAGQPQAR